MMIVSNLYIESYLASNSSSNIINVTVASKTNKHRYTGGSTSSFIIGGKQAPFLTFVPGKTYKFNQDDTTNSFHPIGFYTDANKAPGSEWITGVYTSGNSGTATAYTEITITTDTPDILLKEAKT